MLVERYAAECGIRITTIVSDNDTKFERSFKRNLRRRNIDLRISVGEQKNAHCERAGRVWKTTISRIVRARDLDWPLCLDLAMRKLNHETLIPGTKFTPAMAYEGENYSLLLAELFRLRPYMFTSPYPVPLPVGLSLHSRLFKFPLGQHCLVDTTGVKPSLRHPFPKISEQRTKVWERGVVVARKLVDTSKSTLVQRYLVKFASGSRPSHWTYAHRLRAVDE